MPDSEIHIRISSPVSRVWKSFPPLISTLLPLSGPSTEASCSGNELSRAELIQQLRRGGTPQLEFPHEIGDWPEIEPPRSQLVPQEAFPGGEFQRQIISELALSDLCGEFRSEPDAIAFKAGLLLFHDDLESAHRHSQSVEGRGLHRAGDFWHAVIHRREPDYSNSKYWFRRVGEHPVFPMLGDCSRRLALEMRNREIVDWSERLQQGPNGWNPFTFVDLCQAAAKQDSPLREFAERLQRREMWLLLESNWYDIGASPVTHPA